MSTHIRMPAAMLGLPLTRVSANVPTLDSLLPIQARFIEEYLIDLDPRQAAIRSGVPVAHAPQRGASYMRHPLVREAIGRAIAERSKRVGLNADRVLARLGALALGDPTSIFNENGGLKKIGDMDPNDRLLIAGVKTRRSLSPGLDPITGQHVMEPEEITEVKTIDQISAVNLAMKHLGLLNEKVDVNVTSLADRLREAQLRRAGVMKGDVITLDGDYEDVSDGSASDDRLGQGDDELRDVIDYIAGDTEAAGAQSSQVPAPLALAAPTPGVLDYDPITGEDLTPAIDWDPLA